MNSVKVTANRARAPKIGDVYFLKFQGEGSVQAGWRPGVVFQNNIGNTHSPNVVVLPMTTSLKKMGMPTHVLVRAADTGMIKDSLVLCENPQCIPKKELGRYIATLPDYYMGEIAAASIMASGAISYMDLGSVIRVWQEATSLNAAS